MKLIKDLGRIGSDRRGIFECPICKKHFETSVYLVNKKQSTKCKSCSSKISHTKHGHAKSKTKEYKAWENMKARCYQKSNVKHAHYSSLNIKVCDRWKNSFENFLLDMGKAPSSDYTLDRINTYGDYEPSNCRWATVFTQNQNTIRIRSSNTSGYMGVHKGAKIGKWVASITADGVHIYLGTFQNPFCAAMAYDAYVIENNLEHTTNI